MAQAYQESRFKPNAVSPAGARGIMQIMPATGYELGLTEENFTDPRANIDAGVRYMARQLKTYKTLDEAAAAYNAGPGNVNKHKGIPPFKETRGYVRNVVQNYQALKNVA